MQMVLADLLGDITRKLDAAQNTTAVLVQFKKAFDTLDSNMQ